MLVIIHTIITSYFTRIIICIGLTCKYVIFVSDIKRFTVRMEKKKTLQNRSPISVILMSRYCFTSVAANPCVGKINITTIMIFCSYFCVLLFPSVPRLRVYATSCIYVNDIGFNNKFKNTYVEFSETYIIAFTIDFGADAFLFPRHLAPRHNHSSSNVM